VDPTSTALTDRSPRESLTFRGTIVTFQGHPDTDENRAWFRHGCVVPTVASSSTTICSYLNLSLYRELITGATIHD
jgi:hypothetical protein